MTSADSFRVRELQTQTFRNLDHPAITPGTSLSWRFQTRTVCRRGFPCGHPWKSKSISKSDSGSVVKSGPHVVPLAGGVGLYREALFDETLESSFCSVVAASSCTWSLVE